GSDYTPFLQHLGIPSSDMGFGGDYGVYHSAYDDFYWMSHFGDPTFMYHVTAARLWGTVAMRLADAPGLPLDYRDYAAQVREFFKESMKTARQRKLTSNISERLMNVAVDSFAHEAELTDRARQDAISQPRNEARLQKINDALIAVERDLTDARGL